MSDEEFPNPIETVRRRRASEGPFFSISRNRALQAHFYHAYKQVILIHQHAYGSFRLQSMLSN